MDGAEVPAKGGISRRRDNNPGSIKISASRRKKRDADFDLNMAPQRKSELNMLITHRGDIEKAIDSLGEKIQKLSEDTDGATGYELEFEEIAEEEDANFDPNSVTSGILNSDKNRYEDILPYDHSRVALGGSEDYINASFVEDLLPGAPLFIAAQGPLTSTKRDFWRMCWEHNVRNIVMLTNIVESDIVKCEQYWPADDQPLQYDDIDGNGSSFLIEMVYEEVGVSWSHRTFKFEKRFADGTAEDYKVSQYHFSDWPDYGVPESAHPFVKFLRVIMAAQQKDERSMDSEGCPLLCHCSAGVGRTGTFMAAYAILSSLRFIGTRLRDIRIRDVVRKMRKSRMYLVQSLSQYEFLHDSVLMAADLYVRTAPAVKNALRIKAMSTNRKRKSIKINKGVSEKDLNPLPAGDRVAEWDDLVRLLTSPSLDVVQALVEVTPRADLDSLTHLLFKSFGAKGALLPLVCRVAEWEVNGCDSEKLVFRRNNIASKLIMACMEAYGQGYRRATLQPLLEAMADRDVSYEVNEVMLQDGDLKHNRHALRRLSERFFSDIVSTLPEMPVAVSLICYGIAIATAKRFPDHRLNSVGGALFLRFFAPAIVCPNIQGVFEEEVTPSVKRGLVLVSKVLQAVATRASGFREAYMQYLNSFVRVAIPRGEEFLRRACSPPKELDAKTIKMFQAYGVPLRTMVGKPKDKSVLGRRRDGTIGGGITKPEMSELFRLLCAHGARVELYLSKAGAMGVAEKFSNCLKKIGSGQRIRIQPPPLWVKDEGFVLEEEEAESKITFGISVLALDDETDDLDEFYPGTTIVRGTVMVPRWELMDRGYDPVTHTSPEILGNPGADPDVTKMRKALPFNQVDSELSVDRRSHHGLYKVLDGIPRNPIRRTGINARGCLLRWGPNHIAEPVVTRWKRERGVIVKRTGKPVLEVLAYTPPGGGQFSLPSGFIGPHEVLPLCIRGVFGKEAGIGKVKGKKDQWGKDVKSIFQNGHHVTAGLVDDPKNTDNAWVESISVNFHDSNNAFLAYPQEDAIDKWSVKWVEINDEADTPKRVLEILAKVADMHKAYFADKVPALMRKILPLVEDRGILTEGIYRVSGSLSRIRELKAAYFAGEESFDVTDVHELTGLLKLVLREMNPPLLGFNKYSALISAVSIRDEMQRYAAFSSVLSTMPKAQFRKIEMLVKHLNRISQEEATNKMSISNLSLVFGPTIMRSPDGLRGDLDDSGHQIKVAKVLLTMPNELWSTSATKVRNNSMIPRANLALEEDAPDGETESGASQFTLCVDTVEADSVLLNTSAPSVDGGNASLLHEDYEYRDPRTTFGYAAVADPDEEEDAEEDLSELDVRWYQAEASRDEIRGLKNRPVGSFIIHNSKTEIGSFCISVWTGDYIWTGLIEPVDGGYQMEETSNRFPALSRLVRYFCENQTPAECKLIVEAPKKKAAPELVKIEMDPVAEPDSGTPAAEVSFSQYYEKTGEQPAVVEETYYTDDNGYCYDEDGNYLGYYDEQGAYHEDAKNVDWDVVPTAADPAAGEEYDNVAPTEYDNVNSLDEALEEGDEVVVPELPPPKMQFAQPHISKSGYLSLGSGSIMGKKLKKRWFVLQDTMLKYYKNVSRDGAKALGYINIDTESSVKTKGDRSFVINTNRHRLLLYARDPLVAKEWVTILQSACTVAQSCA